MATLSVSWSRRLALLSSAALALLLLWLLVRLVWLVVAGPQVQTRAMPPVPQVQPTSAARDGFRWELFGEASPTVPIVDAPVQASRTGMRLKGVMAGGPDAFAIIADEQGRERVYRAGDELPGGARVERIEAIRVLLVREGRREALELERDLTTTGMRTSSAPAPSPASLPGIRAFELPSGVSAAALQPADSSAAAGLGQTADQVSVMPVAGGGFRVRPGRDARLFTELGLQINDVVVAVNGQPLNSEDEARALFADVLRRGELSITINRQGREMTLRPDLEQILSNL